MDISAPEIVFTETGCNFCDQATKAFEEVTSPQSGEVTKRIVLNNLQKRGKRKYDCLIGLSGGVDSAFALHTAIHLGLRPLVFSVDNGWNDPKADENVLNMVEKLGVPFEKHIIDLDKFRELQAAFLAAGQKNVEIPTDHVLMALSLELASKYGIKYIISGGNVATESIMPRSWGYQPRDLTHIKAIYKWHHKKNLNTGLLVKDFDHLMRPRKLPTCGLLKWNWYKWVKGIETIYLLDYYPYNREKAKEFLMKNYKYQDVGEKHEESIFTRWFQSFWLFEKFGIDKRRAHYSSMIVSGQMTREEAMEKLQASPVYPELGIERKVMKYKIREYNEFPTDEKWFERISSVVRFIKKILK